MDLVKRIDPEVAAVLPGLPAPASALARRFAGDRDDALRRAFAA